MKPRSTPKRPSVPARHPNGIQAVPNRGTSDLFLRWTSSFCPGPGGPSHSGTGKDFTQTEIDASQRGDKNQVQDSNNQNRHRMRCVCTPKRACKLPPHYGTSPFLLRRCDAIQRGSPVRGGWSGYFPGIKIFRYPTVANFRIYRRDAGESKKDLSFGGGVAFYAAWSREALNRTGIFML
ncbi:uncharacterized protein K444DRAFT_364641 [Hyaloscypha bicolor E]|uniref:Uncharacterized protein n=1 Tax=Hyaloscypha bicolor E TaxID=1095630 RepID=A0A2J6TDS5_9HELO|nr:uncharacterized protein K444DRAFT_364641 [Hyaloscypha bicolor E]PMD61152.1 hypothetical protein K444DRAFT_364641 [Hyaloscypha bicolor E]